MTDILLGKLSKLVFALTSNRNPQKTWGAEVTSTPSELLPVNQSVFQAVTEANGSFEKLVADLEALQQVSFFPSGKLADYANVICGFGRK